jgi:hypothetical protein
VIFNEGDKIVLKESSMRSLMQVYGYNEHKVKQVMEVEKVNIDGSCVIKLKSDIDKIIPFRSTHYRLATDSEIKRDKIKNIFT